MSLDSILNAIIPPLVVVGFLIFFYKLLKEPIDRLVKWIRNLRRGGGESGGGFSLDDEGVIYIPKDFK